MSNRAYFSDAQSASQRMAYLEISFSTAGSGNPVVSGASSTLRGEGLATVVASGTQGIYTVTLQDGFRYVTSGSADLQDLATPDGAYATFGNVAGEGSNVGPITFQVTTFDKGGTKQWFGTGGNGGTVTTGNRRVSVMLACKNYGTGK